MKITDPEIIRTGERDLIESVRKDLDWDALGEIVKQRINLSSLDSTQGEIVVHENKVAFRIDFTLKMDLSLMFDRDGVLIPDGEGNQGGGEEEAPGIAQMEEKIPSKESPMEDQDSGLEKNERGEEAQDAGVEPPDFDLLNLEPEGDDPADDEIDEALDDDIDEILKESRDFWENKKSE